MLGSRVTFTANIYTPLDREWFVYNFAAKSFHTKNFVVDVIRLNVNFIPQNDKFAFEPPFVRVRGNIRTLSIGLASWKARGRLHIRDN